MAKKILKNSFIYMLLGFLPAAINFFLLPVYTNILIPYEFGIITLATLVQTVIANLTTLGIHGAFTRQYFDCEESSDDIRSLFTTAFVIQLVAGLLLHLILYSVGDFLFDTAFHNREFTYSKYGAYVCFAAIAGNLQALFLIRYRNEERLKRYGLLALIFFFVQAGFIYFEVVVRGNGALGSVQGRMWGTVLPLLGAVIFSARLFKISFCLRPIVKSMLQYGLPLIPYLLLQLAFSNLDKIIVERYLSLKMLGIYGLALLIISVAEIFINALQAATFPSVIRALKTKDDGDTSDEIEDIFSLTIITHLFITVAIASVGPLVVEYFLSDKYEEVIELLPLMACMIMPRVYSVIYSTGITYSGKTKIFPLVSFVSFFVCLIISISLVNFIGIYAVMLGVFFSLLVQSLLYIHFSIKHKIIIKESIELKQEWMLSSLIFCIVIASFFLVQLFTFSTQTYALLMPLFVVLVFYVKRGWLVRVKAWMQKTRYIV